MKENRPRSEIVEGETDEAKIAELKRIEVQGDQDMATNHENKADLFHGTHHPEAMKKAAKKIGEILEMTPLQQSVVDAAIAHHDVIIIENLPTDGNPLAMLSRKRGGREGDKPAGLEGNEALSAKLLVDRMKESGAFTEDEIMKAQWAIEATYPGVDFGTDFKGKPFKEYGYLKEVTQQNKKVGKLIIDLEKEGLTKGPLFFQPHLENALENPQTIPPEFNGKVPQEVIAVALSDLAVSGTGEFEDFSREGNNEFRELYPAFRNSPEKLDELTDVQADEFSGKILDWRKSQAGFVVFQMMRFEKILFLAKKNGQLSESQEQQLRDQFSHYAENSRASIANQKEMKEKYGADKDSKGSKEAMKLLAEEMGYKMQQIKNSKK